jgi:general secretion pathway protein F
MVRAGETSGTLEIILDRLAEIGEKQMAISNRIKTAMIYPVIMAAVGVIVLFILMAFIVPDITSIFDEMDQLLPAPTRLLIGMGDFFQAYWWVAAVLIPIVVLFLKMVLKTEGGRRLRDRSVLSLPLFGELIRKLAVARFARTLGSLLENGVSMLPALAIVRDIAGNTLISEKIEAASAEVEKGQGLAQSLSTGSVIPYLAIQMIGVGEQTGTLESMLAKIADVFENEAESQVTRLTTLLEPLMILAMAVVVGFIVLSICLPIFDMNRLIR